MSIDEKQLQHWIDNFYGYGSWRARIWFVSYEESGGDLPENVAERLNYFNKVHGLDTAPVLADIRELYRHITTKWSGPKANLYANNHDHRFGSKAILNGVWKNLIAFEHGYYNKQLPNPLTYQINSFASTTFQHEALIKLYPLPSPHGHAWYYSWLDLPASDFLKTRVSYEEHIYERRMRTILSNILEYKPEVVLMYGMNNINILKKTVQAFFHNSKFKMIKAIAGVTPQYHRADLDGTTFLITTQIPALRHNRIEPDLIGRSLAKAFLIENKVS